METLPEFWVFGYGSLMWRPGFAFISGEKALIRGYHRRLCVFSHVHRGTPEVSGLVMGLDRGGSCHGMAFRIDPLQWPETLSYLRAREQVTSVYIEATKPVILQQSGRMVSAVTYLVDRTHRQYAGPLPVGKILEFVHQGTGASGKCIDYVLNTVAHLRDLGIHDARLEDVVRRLATENTKN